MYNLTQHSTHHVTMYGFDGVNIHMLAQSFLDQHGPGEYEVVDNSASTPVAEIYIY